MVPQTPKLDAQAMGCFIGQLFTSIGAQNQTRNDPSLAEFYRLLVTFKSNFTN